MVVQLPSCEWLRHGKGLELQFFAVDEDVDRWLKEGLSPEFGPFEMLTFDMVKKQGTWTEQLARCSSLSVAECRSEGRHSFWIASKRLSPWIFRSDLEVGDCAINGLILLQHQVQFRGRGISRIAMINKIRRVMSTEAREHREYTKIFKALSKRIKKDLTHTTIVGEGAEALEHRSALMTSAAAEAARRGAIEFLRRPGRQL